MPFVRRCQLDYAGGQSESAFIVNINVLGAYVANDVMPPLGRQVVFRFHIPGSEREVVVDGLVAWTNPQQEHPVHSLPAGFGVAFRSLEPPRPASASSRSSSTTWRGSRARQAPRRTG